MNEKFKDFLRQNIGYFSVLFVSVIYVLSSILAMGKTGKTLDEIITDSTVALLLGIFINRVFSLQGLISGENNEKVRQVFQEHAKILDKVLPSLDELGTWCDKKNSENLKIERTKILSSCGLKYSLFFDEEGILCLDEVKKIYDENIKSLSKFQRKLRKQKLKAISHASNLKLTKISPSSLTSECDNTSDIYNFGRTKREFKIESGLSDVFSKVVTALLFGYYGVELITNFSYANLIWKLLQVAIFIVMGTIKMLSSYYFIVDEFRLKILKKIDNLQMFYNEMSKPKQALTN